MTFFPQRRFCTKTKPRSLKPLKIPNNRIHSNVRNHKPKRSWTQQPANHIARYKVVQSKQPITSLLPSSAWRRRHNRHRVHRHRHRIVTNVIVITAQLKELGNTDFQFFLQFSALRINVKAILRLALTKGLTQNTTRLFDYRTALQILCIELHFGLKNFSFSRVNDASFSPNRVIFSSS